MTSTTKLSSYNQQSKLQLFVHDAFLISIMGMLAACGLIYEYLLSHYAGRILGAVETAIYTMIGIMIVAMGIGAFAAKWIKDPFSSFAWLEAVIALLGMTSVLVIASAVAFSSFLPETLSETFGLPKDVLMEGGIIDDFIRFSKIMPYLAGLLLGFMIGMEIPLIARVRNQVYGRLLENNAGTIYGADYVGAGMGAAVWVFFMLSMDITKAAVLTASLNIFAGLIFYFKYRQHIKFDRLLLLFHLLLIGGVVFIANFGSMWMKDMSSLLYKDKVVLSMNTKYQHITITERKQIIGGEPVTDLWLNGRLQFSSLDEHIYHSMLVYPAMMASGHTDKVLIIGGGDGLALRNVLRWQPKAVTMIDLDADVIDLFSENLSSPNNTELRERLVKLNQSAFQDKRLELIIGDAFVEIDKLLSSERLYDTIIVDLPDPSHPDLNKLYSDHFYGRLMHLLAGDGAMVIQSTSPFYARKAFISVGKTVKAAGFNNVEQYRQNVATFGEWGWTIATKTGQAAARRLREFSGELPVEDEWVTPGLILAAFEFPAHFYLDIDNISPNYLGSGVLYQYHNDAWVKDTGSVFELKTQQ